MYKKNKPDTTSIVMNNSTEGITIEQRVRLMMNNGEPLTDSSPLIYTERKEGVLPEHDIRTDRFDHAIEAKDKLAKAYAAKRESGTKVVDIKTGQSTEQGINPSPAGTENK